MCQHFQHPDPLSGEGAIPLHALTRQILGTLPCIQLLQCPSWHFSLGGGGKEEQQHGKCHMRGMLGQSRGCRCPEGLENVGVLSKSQGTKSWDSLSSLSWIQPLSGISVPWVLERGLEGSRLGAWCQIPGTDGVATVREELNAQGYVLPSSLFLKLLGKV